MSAIAGIVKFDESLVDNRELELIAHPMPGNSVDAVSIWSDRIVGFAHALAITTPESVNGKQPLADPVSGCVIAFDGRLDNRSELCATFGVMPTLAADVALVLSAYLKWQTDFLKHLLGDFAIAIWDARAQTLILARDPLGQRPLFYSCDSARIIFASTLEQLLRAPSIARDWDEEALPYYFYAYGALDTQTVYRAIKNLPGGTRLIARDVHARVERYWHLRDAPPEPRALTGNDLDEFRARFTDAVAARLRAERPVGLLLSGGLDSGSIASVAGDLYQRGKASPLRAYSLVFDKFVECDERRYIDAIIARYGLPFTPVPADECVPLGDWARALALFTEPYLEAFDGMKYAALDRARADGVRVMLMGHGGDVLLDGSPRAFADLLLQGRWHALHSQVRAFAQATGRPYWQSFAGNVLSPLMPTWVREKIEYRHWHRATSLIPPRLRAYRFDALPALPHGKHAWWHHLRHQLASIGHTLQEGHLDRTMRAFGIQVRQPFMDVRLFDFVLSLPPEATYSNGMRRYIVRAGLADILPPVIRERRDKASFLPLMHLGLRERRRQFLQALLDDSELARRDIVLDRPWRATIQNYLDGKQDLFWLEWRGIILEIWLRVQTNRLPPMD